MAPVAAGEGQEVNEEAGLVAVEKSDVKVTVSAVDTRELLSITSDAHINPYIYVGDWGIARPRYTVFDVTVKNGTESEVRLNPAAAVLMDETGEQYDVIPYEEFRERYGSYPTYEREIVHYPRPRYYRPSYYRRYRPRSWYYHYDHYLMQRPAYVRRVYSPSYFKRAIISGTMLKSVKLYPGGKRQGLVAFPILPPDASMLKIIVPGVIIDNEEKRERVNFEFHFERIPAMKGQNDDKEDAGTG